jgi:hypothetical protein
MANRRLQELNEELQRLMLEEVQSLRAQTFGGMSKDGLQKQKERLQRIREVSADLLAALKAASSDSTEK